jgi:hypothetical protein
MTVARQASCKPPQARQSRQQLGAQSAQVLFAMLYQRAMTWVYSKGLRNIKHLLTVITWNDVVNRQDGPWSAAAETSDVTSARAYGARAAR